MREYGLGPFNNYVDKMRGEGVKKCLFFVHDQSIKTVQVVVKCPLCLSWASGLVRKSPKMCLRNIWLFL